MALKQLAFFSVRLNDSMPTGTGFNLSLDDYTDLNSNLSDGDTIYLVVERTSATNREIILVSRVSAGNYQVDSRGLYDTTERVHGTDSEVTCDDVPGYYYASTPNPQIARVGASETYTTIQSAIDALTTGGIIQLVDDSYTITSTILFKYSNTTIIGNERQTELICDGSSVTTLIKSNTTNLSNLVLKHVNLRQTNATEQGVAIDWSNIALGRVEDVRIDAFGTGIKMNDTVNFTFYNAFRDIQMFSIEDVGIDITSTNPVNNNSFYNIRTSYAANGTGLIITNGQGNVFYSLNVEPASTTGTTGISLTAAAVTDTVFIGAWVEGNATGVSINSAVLRTTFIGGDITSNTANLADSSPQTTYIGTRIGDALRNEINAIQVNIDNASAESGITIDIDSSDAGNSAIIAANNTNFAHSGDLIDLSLVNASDSGKVIRIKNAGTGRSLSIENGSGTARFTVTQAGKVDAFGAMTGGIVALSDGATPALDASLGNHFTLTAAGDRTIAVPSNPTSGQKITIAHTASGADRTLALNTGAGGFAFGTDITALSATTSAKTDYIGCIYDAGSSKWRVVSYVKGF